MAFLWMCKVHQLRANFPSSALPGVEMGSVRDPAAPLRGRARPLPAPARPAHPDKETHHVSPRLLSRGRATGWPPVANSISRSAARPEERLRDSTEHRLPPSLPAPPPERRAPAPAAGSAAADAPGRGGGGEEGGRPGATRRPAAPPGLSRVGLAGQRLPSEPWPPAAGGCAWPVLGGVRSRWPMAGGGAALGSHRGSAGRGDVCAFSSQLRASAAAAVAGTTPPLCLQSRLLYSLYSLVAFLRKLFTLEPFRCLLESVPLAEET